MQIPARLAKSLSLPSTSTILQDIASARKGVAKVVLKKGKTQLFRDGSPMVYSGAVDRIIGRPPPKTGDVVLVADGTEKPIGWGMYNSVSMFCVRLMQLEEEAARDPSGALNIEKLLETRIDAAVELRKSLGLPSEDTDAYRLINSEGDRLSGLIVDIFGNFAVVASSAAWVEKYRSEIEFHISRVDKINCIKWRPSVDILKEEGLDLSEQNDSSSVPSESVKVKENGLCYAISLDGQKTGFYADQRENRHFISSISKGRKVLDICCYSGGFALNAAKGGATHVIGIDSSLPALELANENVHLNKLDPTKVSFLKEDATQFMKAAAAREECWDLIILDPPKLAPRRKGAASMAGRKVTVLREAGAACDHPIDPSYPEGAYLTNILLRILSLVDCAQKGGLKTGSLLSFGGWVYTGRVESIKVLVRVNVS
ncbi:hypothetical protein ACLOJK_029896 [Asimina triloba]